MPNARQWQLRQLETTEDEASLRPGFIIITNCLLYSLSLSAICWFPHPLTALFQIMPVCFSQTFHNGVYRAFNSNKRHKLFSYHFHCGFYLIQWYFFFFYFCNSNLHLWGVFYWTFLALDLSYIHPSNLHLSDAFHHVTSKCDLFHILK